MPRKGGTKGEANPLTGLSLDKLINMPYGDVMARMTSGGKVDQKALRKAASQVFQAANKRVARLEKTTKRDKTDYTQSTAYKMLQEGGGRFYTKGLDYNALQREYKRAVRFLRHEQSTKTGYREFLERVEKDAGYKPETYDQRLAFSELLNRLHELKHFGHGNEEKYQKVKQIINEVIKEHGDKPITAEDIDIMLEKITKQLDAFEEEYQERQNKAAEGVDLGPMKKTNGRRTKKTK